MKRTLVLISVVIIGSISTAMCGFSQTPAGATPENAVSFIGDWTLSAQGNQRPAEFGLSIRVEEGKVVGSIAMGQGNQSVTDITLAGKTLVLNTFSPRQPLNAPAVSALLKTHQPLTQNSQLSGND